LKHPVDRETQKNKVQIFSNSISEGLNKTARRFVEDALVGISLGGSLRLTEISRALMEDIPLHATHKRLSRNLANPAISDVLSANLLQAGALQIQQDTPMMLYGMSVQKKYATKMAYLADIPDGRESTTKGYHLCEVVGCAPESDSFTPLAQTLWSESAPGFESSAHEILSLVKRVQQATAGRGFMVANDEFDQPELLAAWMLDESARIGVSLKSETLLHYKNQQLRVDELCQICETPYGNNIYSILGGSGVYRQNPVFASFGFLPVRLPAVPDRPLWLIVIKDIWEEPRAMLTTEEMRRSRQVLTPLVKAYCRYWAVTETSRYLNQSYNLDDIRVLTYQRLRNITVLLLALSHFDSLWPDVSITKKGVRFSPLA
jgi:hypothetical protein|tara:strand:- start:11554 stop:12678 length:1125 start_codon:yes stop_codon:yes gene_type:complete